MIAKAQAAEEIDKLYFIKVRNLSASKDSIKKVNRHTEWVKIFENRISSRLVAKIYFQMCTTQQ